MHAMNRSRIRWLVLIRRRWKKIFYNLLLSNAIKYTEGEYRHYCGKRQGKTYKYAWPIRDKVFLPEKQKQLFDRFERLGADKEIPQCEW